MSSTNQTKAMDAVVEMIAARIERHFEYRLANGFRVAEFIRKEFISDVADAEAGGDGQAFDSCANGQGQSAVPTGEAFHR